jgi:uncharacterized membrane protein YdbT with pleckstrin-like domain
MADDKKAATESIFNAEPTKLLWKDRKRILGMPISFTRYEFDSDRFVSRIGLLRTVTNEILLYRILDIKMTQTLGQKIFGVGTLMLFTADQSDRQFPLTNIKHPEKIRRALSELVEKERMEKRMLGREMYGTAAAGMIDIDGDGLPG